MYSQTTSRYNNNLLSSKLKNVLLSFLLNSIIPIYTVVTIFMSLYHFFTGTSELIMSNSRDRVKNSEQFLQRRKSIYYILLGVVGCIALTLRSLVNSDWVNLFGILINIAFILFSKYYKVCHSKQLIYNPENPEKNILQLFEKFSIKDHIFGEMIVMILNRKLIDIISESKYDSLASEIGNKIKHLKQRGIFIWENYHAYFFELITACITTLCIILNIAIIYKYGTLNIVALYNNAICLIRLINFAIVVIVFCISVMYLILNIRQGWIFVVRVKILELGHWSFNPFDKAEFVINNSFLAENNILLEYN